MTLFCGTNGMKRGSDRVQINNLALLRDQNRHEQIAATATALLTGPMVNGPRAMDAWTSPIPAPALAEVTSRPFSPGATLTATFQGVVARQAASLARHRGVLAVEPSVEAVHESRRAIARLRAALRFFDGALAPADHGWIDGELSTWARRLGEARDLDILVRRLARGVARDGGPRSHDALRHAIAMAAREMIASRVVACVNSARVTFLVDGLLTWAKDERRLSAWADGSLAFATEGPRRLRLLRDPLPSSDARIDRLGAKQRHGLRKKLKVLRYSGDIVREFLDEPATAEDARLLAVLDVLGDLNDAEVCDRLAKRLFAPLGPAAGRSFADATSVRRHLEHLRGAWTAFASATALVPG